VENVKDMSLEELIKLVDEKPKRNNTKKISKSYCKFIADNNVARGELKVPSYYIYFKFREWCGNTNNKKISKVHFFRLFNKDFDQVRHGYQRYYLINDVFDISEEELKEAKEFNKKVVDKHIKGKYDGKKEAV
jgi:hypothetical protein